MGTAEKTSSASSAVIAQHVRDGMAAVVDLQRLAVVALAGAHLAGHVDVRQELHLDLEDAVALAVLAATALHVEAEAARAVAPHARLRDAREQLPDGPEQAGVGGRVGARRPADRALVDLDDLVHRLHTVEAVVERPARPGRRSAALASALNRMSVTSVLLPDPETPVTAVNVPSGNRTSRFWRLCSRALRTRERLAVAEPAPLRDGHHPLAAQEGAGQRPRLREHRRERCRWR